MCWNEEISFMTGLMSTVIALYIKKRNGIDDQWCGNLLLSIAAMQIVEFFAWIIIKHIKPTFVVNSIISFMHNNHII